MYQGKPLSRWLNYRTALKPMPRKIQEQEADDAVRQVGTNALSTLLRMLRAKESRWKTELMYWAQRQPIITMDYTRADEWNWAARRGFEVLGAKAQSAVPALIEIANQNISPESQYWAIDALGFIGPSAP